MIIIPINGYNWEYTLFSDKPTCLYKEYDKLIKLEPFTVCCEYSRGDAASWRSKAEKLAAAEAATAAAQTESVAAQTEWKTYKKNMKRKDGNGMWH